MAFLLVSNTIATKLIYDAIFSRYDTEANAIIAGAYSESMTGNPEYFTVEGTEGKLQCGLYEGEEDTEGEGILLILAPGLHAGLAEYAGIAEYMSSEGMDVLLFDPTGTRQSEGRSNIGYSQETYDLDAVLTYAQASMDYEEIYLMGHSRGATAAVSLLCEDNDRLSSDASQIDGVIAVSGFDSAMDAVIGLSSGYVGGLARLNAPTLWAYQRLLFDGVTLNGSCSDIINDTETPVLILQGSGDGLALPDRYSIYSHREELVGENVTVRLYTEEGKNGHTDILYDDSDGALHEEAMEDCVTWILENKDK